MKILLQRVNRACVKVEGRITGEIHRGLLALVGFGPDDTEAKLEPMAEKIVNMRLFADPNGESHFHLNVRDISGGILAVPQFTLYADTTKGRRPDFFKSLPPAQAEPLFNAFAQLLRKKTVGAVGQGVFGAYMQVELENDGPVTIMVEG